MTYCGRPTLPGDLLVSWNPDPRLLGATAVGFCGLRLRARPAGSERTPMFAAAAVLLIAFTSPFRALSSAHSLARIFHHMLLVAVAAPLIAWALPATLRSSPLQLAAVAQAVAPWFWHAPAPYRAALSDPLVYWTMELSLLATAVLFWSALKVRRDDFVPVMGVLGGAVLTFAPELLYDPHLRAPLAFGLTPLNDQRVAGLLIGAPGAAPYAAAALAIVARLLIRRPEAPSWRG